MKVGASDELHKFFKVYIAVTVLVLLDGMVCTTISSAHNVRAKEKAGGCWKWRIREGLDVVTLGWRRDARPAPSSHLSQRRTGA